MSDHTPTADEVKAFYGKVAIDDTTRINTIIETAERYVESVLDDAILRRANVRGDRKDINIWIACHMIQLTEGGETGSQSSSAGNVTYNTVTGETQDTLSETRWGRMVLEYKRPRANISVERTF